MKKFHRLYIEFLYYFNIERDYYECHEVMEEYWMNQGNNGWLQSLLQVAVGLHHFRNQNINGAIKLFEQALRKKEIHWDGTLGIDDLQLFQQVEDYVNKLYRYEQEPFSFYDLTIKITDPSLRQLVEQCVPEGVDEDDKF
ncbi:hypothetical protein BEP19_16240 [Ammoniphilus oxalaticus]|uniref:DUF309 domain-containing protein n=1 Tax=Ammoniphilus oxalaticus TaxID=66863 RepID=A0A419SQL7_9BACL|nr:DUF309 domain-containing protein [Ammoniphilus oxalaticus]RKD26749.1 hypothetical protein BEP19_16240 [Ammoniphilus oxalaticus]